MRCRNSVILIFITFCTLFLSCKPQKTEHKVERLLVSDFKECCNFEDINQWDYTIFEKMNFKYTGKRFQKKIDSNLNCSLNYITSKSYSYKYFEINFWETTQINSMSQERKEMILNSLIMCFGQMKGYHIIQDDFLYSFNNCELPYWENEEYRFYLYDAYELWGCKEKFENFKIIIQIK